MYKKAIVSTTMAFFCIFVFRNEKNLEHITLRIDLQRHIACGAHIYA